MRQAFGFALVSALAIIATLPLHAGADQTFNAPSGAVFHESVLVSGLNSPTAMAFAPDGRLFVSEKSGSLRVIEQGVLLAQPFITVAGVRFTGERGLLGVAFDPDFATNRYIYVFYSYHFAGVPDGNRVSRFTADPANPNLALAGSERILLDAMPHGGNHNAGGLHFGPDGKLYISLGDVGVSSNSQALDTLAGKILRIDPKTFPNVIPPDNPFVGDAAARHEIWALGLRNPFTFAFDSVTGRMFINDVGQQTWEEINQGVRGANYGWPACEGPSGTGRGDCSNAAFTYPIHAYARPLGNAITCGAFYNGVQFPAEYHGSYFFGDYVGGWLRSMTPGHNVAPFSENAPSPVDCRVGAEGSLYYLSFSEGTVSRIRNLSGNVPPTARFTAVPTSGPSPLVVLFDASTSSDPDGDALTYAWDFGDGETATGPIALHTFDSAGDFTVVLTVTDTVGDTSTASQRIEAGGAPIGIITSPDAGSFYNAGDMLTFSGTASDPDDGVLGPGAFSWTIVFHHDTHTHPFEGPITGVMAGTVAIPTIGEPDTDVFYRVHLTVTDSNGLMHTSFVDVRPRTVNLTLNSFPQGLTLTLDGQPVTTPHTFPSVVGFNRAIGAPGPQSLGGRVFAYAAWAHGGPAEQTFITPGFDALFYAAYRDGDPLAVAKATYLSFGNGDGTGDTAIVLNSSDVGEGNALTVSMWVKPSANNLSMHLIARGRSGFEQWVVRRVAANNKFMFSVRNANGLLVSAESPVNSMFDLGWHHLTGVYDGATVRLYVDGSLNGTISGALTGAISPGTNTMMCLGGLSYNSQSCSTGTMRGSIDDVRIWDRALNAGEVIGNMHGELMGNEPGLLTFLRLNDGAGQWLANTAMPLLIGRRGWSDANDAADPAWIAPVFDVTPPVLGSILSTGVTTDAATISWNTNEVANSQVEYGTTESYGSFTVLDPTLTLGHSMGLTGLLPGTTYYYRVRSRDAAGNLAMSGSRSFVTASIPLPPPPPPPPPPSGPDRSSYLAFDGDDTVRIENSSGVPAGPLTVALWVRTTTTGTSVNLISKGRSGLDQWLIRRIGATGRIRFQVRGADGTLGVADSATDQGADGKWHHYAGTWDGAVVRLYVDGSSVDTTSSPLVGPMRTDDEPVCVGSYGTSSSACGGANLTGDVDDVSLWNRALSQAEIAALMAAELSGVEAGLLGYWRMNEGTGQTMGDATGGNRRGLRGNSTSVESSDPTWKANP